MANRMHLGRKKKLPSLIVPHDRLWTIKYDQLKISSRGRLWGGCGCALVNYDRKRQTETASPRASIASLCYFLSGFWGEWRELTTNKGFADSKLYGSKGKTGYGRKSHPNSARFAAPSLYFNSF